MFNHKYFACIGALAFCLGAAHSPASAATASEEAAATLGDAKAGPSIKLPKLKLGILQLNAQAEVAFRIAEGARIPAQELGWDVVICDSQGDPAKMASCASSLLNQGVNAIMAVAIEPAPVMAQLREAKAKNVPWFIIGGGATPNELITAQFAPRETEMSDLLHEYLVKRLAEKGPGAKTIAISTFSAVWAGKQRSDALYKDVKGKNIKIVDEHVSDLANQIADARQSVTHQLTAFPKLDAILGTADYTLPVMGQLVAQYYPGKSFPDRPLVIGYLDDLINLDAIRKGQADVLATMRLDACGWVAVDQLAQFSARKAAVDPNAYLDSKRVYGMDMTEATLIDKANLPPPGKYVEPSGDFQTFFHSKWKREFIGIGG